LDLAEAMYLELLDHYTANIGADRPTTLFIRGSLGLVYMVWGKLDQAEPHLQHVLHRSISLYGEDHPIVLARKCFLARLSRKQRKYDQAARLYEEIIAKQKEKHRSNFDTLLTLSELAQTRLEAKQLDKARPLIDEVISGFHRHLSAESLL